ncbi:XdhC/CoxI family protein, partial [Candidatus Parcubacteria bacterium]
ALEVALRSPAFYVGALGSRKTHAARLERLRAAGLTAEQLRRIHAPIGLDLGGRAPAEIALAILAEIVSARYR